VLGVRLSKRRLFDDAARDGGYSAIATGHNLDDEAAVLLGNALRWDMEYLARQLPVLPRATGSRARSSRLMRLSERETAAWCITRGVDYQVEECPMAAGNRHRGYKSALDELEARSPGTKASFYLGFIERMAPLLTERKERDVAGLSPCTGCGAPTPGEVCAFCRLVETASSHDPVSVDMLTRAGARRR
jgi:uncharacterized protein (TIGR00269 family)